MAWYLTVTIVAMLTCQASGAYRAGFHRLAGSDIFKNLQGRELRGVRDCQNIIDQDDPRKVQHVQVFYWLLEDYVVVSPSYRFCLVPGQVYSYDTCGCEYATGYTGGEGPRFGDDLTTERVPEKCKDLAGLMYDEEEGRYVSSSYASMKGETADLRSMTQQVDGTSSGYALRLGDGAIKLQAFAGNDLRETWRASLRVMPMGQGNRMTLLSDDCDEVEDDDRTKEDPSLVLSMAGSTLSIMLRFKNATETTQCSISRSDWYEIVIESVQSRVTGTVNGEDCFDIPSPGAPLAMTECALFIGGDPMGKDQKQNFDGYVDTFEFVKKFDTCVMDDEKE